MFSTHLGKQELLQDCCARGKQEEEGGERTAGSEKVLDESYCQLLNLENFWLNPSKQATPKECTARPPTATSPTTTLW